MGDEVGGEGSDIIDLIEIEPEKNEGSRQNDTNKKLRSPIYSHFTLDPQTNRWKCNYCRCSYKKSADGGCGSLHNHMKQNHASKFDTAIQKKITDHMQRIEKEKEDVRQISQEDFNEKLVKFVVCSDQPFSVVEDEDFVDLLNGTQGPSGAISLPGRTKMRQLINERYKLSKTNIQEELKLCDAQLNFVIDCWSSANGHAFQGVVVSWIASDWSLKSAVIDLTRVNGSHTGDNLGDHFVKVLDEYEIYGKLLSVTTDNASNMGSLFKRIDAIVNQRNEVIYSNEQDEEERVQYPKSSFNSQDYRIRCLAHIINLACRAILNSLEGPDSQEDSDSEEEDEQEVAPTCTISKLRRLVKRIRNSQEKRDWIRGQCKVANIKANELRLDMKVRWNSTLYMIERALELQGPLNLTTSHFNDLVHLSLSNEEWIQLKEMKKILLPFKDATLLFSKNAPMLSSTLHIYEILFAHLEKYLPSESTKTSYRQSKQNTNSVPTWLSSSALAGWNKLKKYYPYADGLAYKVATIMDPTRKDKWYGAVGWSQEWIKKCKSDVKRLWNSTYKKETDDNPCDSEPPSKKAKNSVEEQMELQMLNIPRGTPEDELTRYLREHVAPPGTDVLLWWKKNEETYPKLSKMAKDFLSIFGTGVPVERLFSDATDTLTHRRYRLSPSSINECLCLKSWYKLKKGSGLHNDLATALKEMILGDCNDSMDDDKSEN